MGTGSQPWRLSAERMDSTAWMPLHTGIMMSCSGRVWAKRGSEHVERGIVTGSGERMRSAAVPAPACALVPLGAP